MSSINNIISVILISSTISGTFSQKISGSNIVCGSNNACSGYNITCDAGSDCMVNCVGGSSGFGHQCSGATIECPDNYKCSIQCDGQQSCSNTIINGNNADSLIITTSITGNQQLYQATINCPDNINSDCKVECDNQNQQCYSATINAEQSRSLNLTCLPFGTNIANEICSNAMVKCPRHNLFDGSCFIEGHFTQNTQHTQNMQISSLYGFNSVTISGFVNIGTMHCNTGYSQSCLIGVDECRSCNGGCNCDNPIISGITSGPTNYPTNYPSNYPSNIPTSSPLNAATNGPSNYPSLLPTNSPSRLPTGFPSRVPTNGPSNYPSYSPTSAPTQDFKNKANVTVTFKNGTNIENITDVVKENVSPGSLVALISTEPSGDKVTAVVAVSSDETIEAEVIEEGIKNEYGPNVEDVEITVDNAEDPGDDARDDIILVFVVTIAVLLLIICMILLVCIYYKRKDITDSLKEGTSTHRITSTSIASAATRISIQTNPESTELMEISSNTPQSPAKSISYMHVVTASDCLPGQIAHDGPENDPEIFSEGGAIDTNIVNTNIVNNNHNNNNNVHQQNNNNFNNYNENVNPAILGNVKRRINKVTPQFSVEDSEHDYNQNINPSVNIAIINNVTPQFSVENSEYDDMYDAPQNNTPGNIVPVADDDDDDDDCSVLYNTGNDGGEVLQTPKLPPPPTRGKPLSDNNIPDIPEMEEIDDMDHKENEDDNL